MRRFGRALLHASSLVLALAIAAIAAVTCVLYFPPTELLRRAALPLARQELRLAHLDLGSLDFSLGRQGHLTITDLSLGPPAGYTLPLLTTKRISLRYDLRKLGAGQARLEHLVVIDPVLRVERRDGKPNWAALLEALGPPPPEDATTALEKPEEAAAPFPLKIDLDHVTISGLAAFIDDAQGTLGVEGLGLRLRGSHSTTGSHGRLTVQLEKHDGRRANLGLRMTRPHPVFALLDTRMRLEAQVESIEPLVAKAKVELDVQSERLEASVPTKPISLALRLSAASDGQADRTRLEQLSLKLNGHDIVEATGQVTTQTEDPRLALSVEHLTLPLDLLCPYAALMVPHLSCGGTVRLAELDVRAAAKLLGQGPPESSRGRLEIDDVWARLASAETGAIDIRGINGLFHLANTSGASDALTSAEVLKRLPLDMTGQQPPATGLPITVRGRLQISKLKAPGARVDELSLHTSVGLTTRGLTPRATATRVRLDLPQIRYADSSLGSVRSSLHAELEAHADLESSAATLESLRLRLGKALRLRIRGSARELGKHSLEAMVHLPRVSLPKLIATLPPRLRAQLPLKKTTGQIELRVGVRGRLPSAVTAPLALPLRVELHSRFKKVGLRHLSGPRGDPTSQVVAQLKGASGEIRISGKPHDLNVSVASQLATLSLPQAGLRLEQLNLPLALEWRRDAIEGTLRARMSRVVQRQPGQRITLKQPHFDGQIGVEVPLARLLGGSSTTARKLRLALRGNIANASVQQPGSWLRTRVKKVDFELKSDGRLGRPLSWTLKASLDKLREKTHQLSVQKLGLTASGEFQGLALRVPTPVLALDDLSGQVQGALNIAGVSSPIAGKTAKRLDTALELAASLEAGGPLQVSRLSLSVPGFGAQVDASATVPHPLTLLTSTSLPGFSVRLAADIDSADFGKSAVGLTLPLQLVGVPYDVAIEQGKLGLRLQATHATGGQLSLSGRALAKGVNLRAAQLRQAVEGFDDLSSQQSQLTLRISNLEADIPIRQQAQLRLDPPAISLPTPARSILTKRSEDASYRFVRPFVARRTTLSLDRIQLVRELFALSPASGPASKGLLSRNELTIGRTVLDLALEDATAKINQVYVKLFGGDISGRLQLQVPQLTPLDLRLSTDIQLSNVDFAQLDPEARKRGEHTYISGLARLNYELAAERASGTVLLTDISLDALDSLLASLDPHGIDESIQANRQIINAWYTRAASPRVSKIPIWVNYSHVNLDIELDAPWPVSTLLRGALSKVRPRRVSIKPILHKVATGVRGVAQVSRPTKTRSARRGELR